MAVLSFDQINNILLKRPNKEIIEAGEAMHHKLSMHINGIGLADYLMKVETYERPEALALRKRYARSNIDLFDRLLRPVDKVFNARGGGRYIKLPTEEDERQFNAQLLDVANGYNSKKWVETFWEPHYHDDPMGVIYMEVKTNTTYPTYKSICDIWDYQPNGRKLEYIVFKTEEPDIFRVVDDRFDALYKVEGERATRIGTIYPNYFGYVPGLIISDLPKATIDNVFVAPCDTVVELADEFLRDGSIRNIYKFKNGFPKTWKYREICGDCKGTGAIGAQPCKPCNGTGKKLDSSVAEVMVLDWPKGDDKVIAPDVAGFITPDLEYLKFAREELTWLEDVMNRTHWGSSQVMPLKDGNPETATGRFIDAQPVNERLAKYADAAEAVEKFIIDAKGLFTYNSRYKGCSITYGRRFLIEGPDALWEKYEKARQAGAPMGTLNEHLREYYEAKFQANGMELQKYLKMMRVEPFVHLTVTETASVVAGRELARKIYYAEWVDTLQDVDWLVKTDEDLKKLLTAFATTRYVPVETPAPGSANPQQKETKPAQSKQVA